MAFENKFAIKDCSEDTIIRSKQSAEFKFMADKLNCELAHRLFFTCEDRLYSASKDEPTGSKLYMLIDDSLDNHNAKNSRFCLNMTCKNEKNYIKLAAIKVPWQPAHFGIFEIKPHENIWDFGISVKANNLKIGNDGYLRLRFERWNVKDGIDPKMTNNAPDEVIYIDAPQGSYDYHKIQKKVTINDSETACIIVSVEGFNYSGEVYFEAPFLISSYNENLLPEFDTQISNLKEYIWLGVNLTKKEWPEFKISLNGNTFFDGEAFLRIHRYSPVEIDIPKGFIKDGENVLKITYNSDYHDTVPIAIREMYILQKSSADFKVLYSPKVYAKDKDLHILVETLCDNVDVKLVSDDFTAVSSLELKEKDMYVLTFKPNKSKNNMKMTLSYGEITENITIDRMIVKKDDDVICGSGDFIYTDVSDEKAVYDFLDWFITNEVGNLLTIRPAYRWGGQRNVNPKVWELLTKICNEMGFSYVLMSDGRDLPGAAQNPAEGMLTGDGYLGCQLHERDGQLFYWGKMPIETIPTTDTFMDIFMRFAREFPDTIERSYKPYNISMRDNTYIFRHDIVEKPDMKEAHDLASKEIRAMANDNNVRHTGPSVMFKYFYENGFSWTGAETMDGAFEGLVAFLRGAAKAYGKKKYGVHHALQWSTFPHEAKKRYYRYLLALYLSYMHGVTDINTEEGLWFMEANYHYHNRLSVACAEHRKMEKKLYDFIRTHSRTGEFYTPTAFIHGRYDGWNGFGSWDTWSMPNMPNFDDAGAWKLLKIFYPLNHIVDTGMYFGGYVSPDANEPIGLYSGTPLGNVDAVPIEKSDFSEYSLISFAGYNKAEEEDFDRIINFVKNGGTLIAGLPHFNTITDWERIRNYEIDIINHQLAKIAVGSNNDIICDTINGEEIKIFNNLPTDINIIEKTDSGNPLVYSVNCEKGKIIMINCIFYAGNSAIFPVYERTVTNAQKDILARGKYQIICGEDVEYTAFLQEDNSMHYYLTPVDWYNDDDILRKAELRICDKKYSIDLKFGELLKIVVNNETSAWTKVSDAEILEITDSKVVVQGYGDNVLYVAKNGEIEAYNLSFGDDSVKEINI